MGAIIQERQVIFALDRDQVEDIRKYLRRFQTPKYQFMFEFAIRVGLRISDMLPLKVKHVRGKRRIKVIEQKTKKERTVYFSSSLREIISDYVDGMLDEEYLFPSRQQNRHIGRVRAYQVFNEAGEYLNFEHSMGTHTFRRTFGTMVYEQTGGDIRQVQKMLNHSSASITERYLGFEEKSIEEFMETFDI